MSVRPSGSTSVKDTYEMFDLNRDGLIDKEDLKAAMNTLGFEFSPAEIQRLVMELDPANAGTINFEEFSKLISTKMGQREQMDQIRAVFHSFDQENTGKIQFKDLKRIAKDLGESLTDQELHEMINEADVDNDGEISFEEFVALMKTSM